MRTGKIARLPHRLRERINCQLFNGESAEDILGWINEDADVKAILAHGFGGSPISEQNLSQWRQGGYVEWLTRQDWQTICSASAEEAEKLAGTGLDCEKLLTLLKARIAVALDQSEEGPHKFPDEVKSIKTLVDAVLRIQQGEIKTARVALDRDRLEFDREKHHAKHPVESGNPEPPPAPKSKPAAPPAASAASSPAPESADSLAQPVPEPSAKPDPAPREPESDRAPGPEAVDSVPPMKEAQIPSATELAVSDREFEAVIASADEETLRFALIAHVRAMNARSNAESGANSEAIHRHDTTAPHPIPETTPLNGKPIPS